MNYEVISLVGLIVGSIGFLLGAIAVIIAVSMKLSTHKIEWRTLSTEDTQDAKEMQKLLDAELEEVEYDFV